MDNFLDIRVLFAWLGTFFSEYMGGFDSLIYVLIIFMIVDYLTGVIGGVASGKLSSNIGFIGIYRKIMMLCLVGMANVLDQHILQTESILRTTVIFFYLSNEGISILENTAILGVPVPNKLHEILKRLKDE